MQIAKAADHYEIMVECDRAKERQATPIKTTRLSLTAATHTHEQHGAFVPLMRSLSTMIASTGRRRSS